MQHTKISQEVFKKRFNKIFSTHYLNLDKQDQMYKSMAGQRTIFIEIHQYFLNASDEEIIKLQKGYKKYFVENYTEDSYYVDLALIKDLIDYQIVIRDINNNFNIQTAFEIIKSYKYNQNLAKDVSEINSLLLKDLIDTIFTFVV